MLWYNETQRLGGGKITPLSPQVFPVSSKSIMCNCFSSTESSDFWNTAVPPQGIFHSASAQFLSLAWFDFTLSSLPQSIYSITYSSKTKTGKLTQTDLKTELPLVWLVKLCIPAPGWVKPKHPAVSRPVLSWRLDLEKPFMINTSRFSRLLWQQRYLSLREN